MRPIESKFKIYEEPLNQRQYFNKLVDERAFFEVYPNVVDYEMLEPTRRKISAFAKSNIIDKDGSLMRIFEQNARVVNTNARTIQWTLDAGDGDIRATLMKVYTDFDTNKTIGKGNTIFQIGLDVEWFGPNDLLILEGFREMPILVQSEPSPEGEYWVYDVMIWGNPKDYFVQEDLAEGRTRLMQTGSLIGESTINRGNIYFGEGSTKIEFEVPMTRMGWQMKITDNAQMLSTNYRLVDNYNDEANKKPDILWNSLEMKFMAATNRQVDLWLTYGRSAGQYSSRFLDGMTEKPLFAGPGLFEFMESSIVNDYPINAFTLELFTEFLPTVWQDKVDIESRITHIYTGTGGLLLWQKACKESDVEGVMQTEDLNYVSEAALFPGRKGVTIGAKQYRAIFIEPFGKVIVHYLPFLDSELIETRRYKNLPITSYQFIIFNYGYGDGKDANIYLMKNSQVEQFGYSVGTWGPLGGTLKQGNRFHTGNGLENAFLYIHETMFGMVVKDPSYMLWYRPAFA